MGAVRNLLVAVGFICGMAGTAHAADDTSSAEPGAGFLEINPGGGVLGAQPLFFLRGAYTVSPRFAFEAEVGHNVGELVSAFTHSAGVRFRALDYRRHSAFLTAGFGSFSATEGDALGARGITRSQLRVGGGVVLRLRDDVGIRLDARHHRVLFIANDAPEGSALSAGEISVGLVFQRRIWEPPMGR